MISRGSNIVRVGSGDASDSLAFYAGGAQKMSISTGGTVKADAFAPLDSSTSVLDFSTDNVIKLFTNSTERMTISSGGVVSIPNGIVFNNNTTGGTPNATGVTLNDYEEGTWTPAGSANVDAIGSQSAFYTKIGNKVTVSFYANINPTNNTAPIGPDQIGDRDALTLIFVHCLLTSCTVVLRIAAWVCRAFTTTARRASLMLANWSSRRE